MSGSTATRNVATITAPGVGVVALSGIPKAGYAALADGVAVVPLVIGEWPDHTPIQIEVTVEGEGLQYLSALIYQATLAQARLSQFLPRETAEPAVIVVVALIAAGVVLVSAVALIAGYLIFAPASRLADIPVRTVMPHPLGGTHVLYFPSNARTAAEPQGDTNAHG